MMGISSLPKPNKYWVPVNFIALLGAQPPEGATKSMKAAYTV